MKFIRKNGRIIPISGDGSAPKGSGVSKRYGIKKDEPKINKLNGIQKASITSVGAAAGALLSRGKGLANLAFGTSIGVLVGHGIGSISFTKKGKGESSKQLANRIRKTGI